MNKKHIGIMVASLALAITIGGVVAVTVKEKRYDGQGFSTAVSSQATTLAEEFWNVDLIIRGTVVSEGETYSQDTGIATKRGNSMLITPATIQVDKVLYGEIDKTEITYLQHGSTDDPIESGKMVKPLEDVLLILNRTTTGAYWSYNFDDGIWRVKDGKVKSDSQSELLNSNGEKEQQLEKFIRKITKAAKNKKKSSDEPDI
ncbi:hypothetical protein ACFSTH_13255 [Paenibacillus yanchengensis]|uniref:Uncharacterized protein n=1 Tax=Paenibacillus yanchengensis TaxID=2035833 RepID=A0ABW4YNI8_9BACL